MSKSRTTALAIALVAAGFAACSVPPGAPRLAERPTAAASPRADAQSQKIVAAANAFIATLSAEQKAAALFAFGDDKQRTNWSNFPYPFARRTGVRWGELDPAQRAALMTLLGAVLSPKGVELIEQQFAADDIVKATPPTSGRQVPSSNGGPQVQFGRDYYFVAFVGAPSTTAPWMLQFGGHHLALNATVSGPNLTLSPSLTGGEPLKFMMDGKPVYMTSDEATRAAALLAGLSPEKRAKAVRGAGRIDLVLGPGHDGQRLQPEGLLGGEMTAAEQRQLLGVIEARLGILNADDLASTMADVRKTLDQTAFAWWGPTEPLGTGYFRVTGPSLIIEFSPQAGDARFADPSQHAHNMYRDPNNEYGAAWAELK